MSASPIVAWHVRSNLQLWVLPVAVLLFTGLTTGVFLVLWHQMAEERQRSELTHIAVLLSGRVDPAVMASSNDDAKGTLRRQLVAESRQLRLATGRETAIALLRVLPGGGFSPWFASGSATVVPSAEILASALSGAVTTRSGSALTVSVPVPDAARPAAVLVLETRTDGVLPPPRILGSLLAVVLAGLALARFSIWFVPRQQRRLSAQVEAERLAFLELTAHQLGAPLATFRWWLELLKDPAFGAGLTSEEIAFQVGEAVRRMESILQAMNDAHAVDVPNPPALETIASLEGLVRDAVTAAAPELKRRNQTAEVTALPVQSPVRVNAKLLSGVLQELLYNAISFSPPGSTIEVTVGPEGGRAKVAVADHGCGIPAGDLPHLFRKFARGSNAAVQKPVGNGLGLYLAKRIIESANGTIGIRSRAGKGTEVWFTLPFVKEEASSVAGAGGTGTTRRPARHG